MEDWEWRTLMTKVFNYVNVIVNIETHPYGDVQGN